LDKVKKFVIFPIALLLMEFLLQFYNTYISLFQGLQYDFGRFMPRILLSFLAVLLFVCGIAVLFLWVFTNTSPKTLLNQSAAKAAILAFAIDYLIILLVEPILYSLIKPLYRSDTTPWLYLIFVSLIMTIQSFFVISMILWLILKPLRGNFKFRTKTFLIAALGCLLLYVLFNYANLQIATTILANSKANDAESGTMNFLVYTDKYKNLLKIANAIVYAIQDVIILVFINSCIKHKESVEIQNV
jgi:hypothetical protein